MSKPLYIAVMGLPGVGKSTVARIIAEKTNGTLVSADAVRRQLFPEKRTYAWDETRQVIEEMDRQKQEEIKLGHTIITDALFLKEDHRKDVERKARELGAEFRLVYVVAPEETIKNRIEERVRLGVDQSEADFAIYENRKAQFEPPRGAWLVNNEGDIEMLRERVGAIMRDWEIDREKKIRLAPPPRK